MTYGDLVISGNACHIRCRASRWDVSNYSITAETWLKKSDLQYLRDSLTPGAVGELYNILGKPRFYDKTWTNSNTLYLEPESDTQLYNMREKKGIIIKNISDTPIAGDSGWINCKIEGFLSGSGSL